MLAKVAKAVIGGVVAGAGALGTALADGVITGSEWGLVLSASIAAALAVWATPNAVEMTE